MYTKSCANNPDEQNDSCVQESLRQLMSHNTDSQEEFELVVQYYLHQWQQIEFRRQERSQFTIQLMLAATGVVVAYSQISQPVLSAAIAVLIMVLGGVGLFVAYFLSRDIRIHWLRTREARRRIGVFEEISKAAPPGGGRFASPHSSYAVSLAILVTGIILLVMGS